MIIVTLNVTFFSYEFQKESGLKLNPNREHKLAEMT